MLRAVLLVNAVVLNVVRAGNADHPGAMWLCVAVMVVWTLAATYAYADPARRTSPLLGLDLAITMALMLLSPVVKGADFNATIPGFWVMGALLACAVRYHVLGGLVAGLLLGAADVVIRQELTQANVGNVFLLMIGGPIVGFMCASLKQMSLERDRAERHAAAVAERARLARAVHDGVLQVLALVQRRGAELGGDAAELGQLAGEQEQALRTLIHEQDAVVVERRDGIDLAALLAALEARPGVTVAAPATPVVVPGPVAQEVASVVRACLDNVTTHVGAGAPVWVLLEAWPDRVEVSVRDEGPGIPDGRLDEAVGQGRLGVRESIRGRIRDLGGTAALTTGPGGTEWEFTVPVVAP